MDAGCRGAAPARQNGERPAQWPGVCHVDLGAEPQFGGTAVVVELEQDPLALAHHAQDRALESVGSEVVVGEVGVAHDDAVAGAGVVGLDDSLHGAIGLSRP